MYYLALRWRWWSGRRIREMSRERPKVFALLMKAGIDGEPYVGRLGFMLQNGEREAMGCMVPKDQVHFYAALGWVALDDPEDEAALNAWLQANTPRQPWNKL